MEALEGRIMAELKELHAWKNKMMGVAAFIGGLGSLVVKELIKHL